MAASKTPKGQILGVFAELEEALAISAFHGCRFILATAEARPGDASEIMSAKYRAWLLKVFTDSAKAAGARNAAELGRRLLLLYDGAAVAARLDPDRGAAAAAMHSALIALLDAAIPAKRTGKQPR